MQTWWRKYRPYWHIVLGVITLVFFSGIAWAQYIELGPKVAKLEEFRDSSLTALAHIDQHLVDIDKHLDKIDNHVTGR